jgi:hypothetical protein
MLATKNVQRISIFKNGAKLRAETNYEITTTNLVNIKVA